MRLIDADALKAWFFRPYSNEEAYSNTEVRTVIDSQPTIEERKTGRWIDESVVTGTTTGGTTLIRQYRCSVCGGLFGRHTDNYCYNCGAKMETEQ